MDMRCLCGIGRESWDRIVLMFFDQGPSPLEKEVARGWRASRRRVYAGRPPAEVVVES